MNNDFRNIITGLFNEEVFSNLMERWNEPHRYYHNYNHLEYLLNEFDKLFKSKFIDERTFRLLVVTAFFHDAIYDPLKTDNEEKSLELFMNACNVCNINNKDFKVKVGVMIMDTKNRKIPADETSRIFWTSDNSMFGMGIISLIENENSIFKEYQFVPYPTYRQKRIEFLKSNLGLFNSEKIDNDILDLIEYVERRVINVGLYAGSFNPFHVGHMNILKKSQHMFDKVIVAFGNNPDKEESDVDLPISLRYTETIKYNGLVTDLIDKINGQNCDVTLIRGIRNGADLSYESNQVSFIQDIRPGTNIIYIPADKEYEHVSSSAIRNLIKFDQKQAKKYLVE